MAMKATARTTTWLAYKSARLSCCASKRMFVTAHKSRDRCSIHLVEQTLESTPIYGVTQELIQSLHEAHGPFAAAWACSMRFKAKKGEVLLVPDEKAGIAKVLLGLGDGPDTWAYAALPGKLPMGVYSMQGELDARAAGQVAVGWMLGHYSFERYKTRVGAADGEKPKLVWPRNTSRSSAVLLAEAYYFARDLITTPAEDLGPQHLVQEAVALGTQHGAQCSVITGEELLEQGYPAIHTVGRAATRPPALVDIQWSAPGAADPSLLPLVALVGKGVCFDTGGLDIKTAAGMRLMKKDMGGAAFVLALGHLIMGTGLPVRLRILVPTVENAISGNAFRPLDVLQTRAGLTVENGNTDAEGRLILCDALYEAASAGPDFLLDAATLTGAARAALGSELPAVFCNDDAVWEHISTAGNKEGDPVWRLPLHAPYRKLLDSKVADMASTAGDGAQGGAIVAALFLQEFVKDAPRWVHIDMSAYTQAAFAGPGRPEGGEVQALRAVWRFLQERYMPA